MNYIYSLKLFMLHSKSKIRSHINDPTMQQLANRCGALWLRDYMVGADNWLCVSLAERRCSKHIIRHRKYAAPERGGMHIGLPAMLSKLHIFPLNCYFRGLKGFHRLETKS